MFGRWCWCCYSVSDAPVGPGSGSAVWFEDLPPANPAPSTIGVLDEDEESQGMEDDRPRWGRKPMVSSK